MDNDDLGLYLMSALYISAGINHFRRPEMYKRIIPPGFKYLDIINWTSGTAEIALGILLVSPMSHYAAWGIILLLIVIFPANVYHLQQKGAGMKIPEWILWLRLPLQFVLMWWAYLYT